MVISGIQKQLLIVYKNLMKITKKQNKPELNSFIKHVK